MKYSVWKRFIAWVNYRAKLGLRQPEKYYAPTMFYLVKCDKHGYFQDCDHPNGHQCPECLKVDVMIGDMGAWMK